MPAVKQAIDVEQQRSQIRHSYQAKYVGQVQETVDVFVYGEEARAARKAESILATGVMALHQISPVRGLLLP